MHRALITVTNKKSQTALRFLLKSMTLCDREPPLHAIYQNIVLFGSQLIAGRHILLTVERSPVNVFLAIFNLWVIITRISETEGVE